MLNDSLPSGAIRIRATDISHKALLAAGQAEYPEERCQGMPAEWLSRYFTASRRTPRTYQVQPRIRAQVALERVNLVEPLGAHRRFPVIFCRNVMIYFDPTSRATAVQRLTRHLSPGGYLVVGNSESLLGIRHDLQSVQQGIYQRP